MIVTKLVLDKRRAEANGLFPVRIYFYYNSTFYLPTGVSMSEQDWASFCRRPRLEQRMIAQLLKNKKQCIDNKLLQLQVDGKLDGLERSELTAILNGKEVKKKRVGEFDNFFNRFISEKKAKKTIESYKDTHNALGRFCNVETLNWCEIDYKFLKKFDLFLSETRSINGRAVVFRNLRSLYNSAIDNEEVGLDKYPFRRFKIKKEKTLKRSLGVERLRLLRDMELPEHISRYRDIFMLSFYLIGINLVDLLNAKADDVADGRIRYKRSKTKRPYDIKIEPEAQAIIDKYKGKKKLLSVMENVGYYENYLRRMNKAFATIQGFEKVTSYWARHTWATLAAELDIPKETIGAALGHADSSVTDVYIRFDTRKIDVANRLVINFLNSAN